jgi:hypothetical protein
MTGSWQRARYRSASWISRQIRSSWSGWSTEVTPSAAARKSRDRVF